LEAKVFRYLLVLAVFACIATSCGANNATQFDTPNRATSTVNATTAWNSVCAQYNFIPKPSDPAVTFYQGYYGRNFLLDFTLITTRVNTMVGLLNVQSPSTGNDVMQFKIENWGLLGGGGLL
jgi:hypothetical protein